jgi:hypothetical protein
MGYVHARRALVESFDLVPVFSMSQARIALRDGDIDGVLASIHFDDSRMFELLAEVKAMDPHPPFVCCALLGSTLSERSLRGLMHAAQEQGCAAFVDYNTLQRKEGFAEADKQFRNQLLGLFPPPCGSKTAAA